MVVCVGLLKSLSLVVCKLGSMCMLIVGVLVYLVWYGMLVML